MGWFHRNRPKSAIEILTSGEWMCSQCDQPHHGMIDFAAFAPDPWRGDQDKEPNSAIRFDGDFLSEDFCVMGGEHFFVRCVLDIPVHGLAEKFGFGCWGTLSKSNFELYVDGFDDGDYANLGPLSSWLCNQLLDYIGTEPEACWMHPQLGRQRPALIVQDEDYPLGFDQRHGVPAETILEIYRRCGHEVSQ